MSKEAEISKKWLLSIDARSKEMRKQQAERINILYNSAVEWYKLLIGVLLGISQEHVKNKFEPKLQSKSRKEKIEFIDNIIPVVFGVFRIPRGAEDPLIFQCLTELAFSPQPPPVNQLPSGWDRLTIITALIRTANNSPQDVANLMLKNLSESLNWQSGYDTIGTGFNNQAQTEGGLLERLKLLYSSSL